MEDESQATTKVRRRRKMLQQMQQNDRQEDEFHHRMKMHEKQLLDDAFRRTVTGLVVVFFIGIIALVTVRPKFLFPRTERLPSRTITTVYPRHLKIAEALPPVVLGYAIVSDRNEQERAAVRKVEQQRQLVTYNAARGVRQLIQYNPIEHGDFVKKLITSQPGALDYFCGSGYQHMYQQRARSFVEEDAALDDMLLACLMHSGTADGYVKHSVQLHSSLARGTQGVAVQYRNEKRIHSDFMWMPILERVEKSQQHHPNNVPPSTKLPLEMTKFLLATVEPTMSEWIYRQEWEEFLYKVIVGTEASKWTLFTAVCTKEEQEDFQSRYRWIATSCRRENECCWIFDPALEPR